MKKLIAMLLTVTIVIGMAACGSTAVPTTAAPATEAATTTAAATTVAATTTAATTAAATTAAATTAATEVATEAPKEITNVDYYCSIGAYLFTLQEEIDKWNAGEGKEKGVYINLISNINTYSDDLTALMEAGTHYDIIHAGTNAVFWMKGYIQSLSEIDNPEIQALVESYRPLLSNGVNIMDGQVTCLPTTAVPVKLAVNLDLFEKNNLELPKTWDDVVNCAKVITDNGNGQEFGFGWSTWSTCWRRLLFKPSMASTGIGWWNNNTAEYDFSVFRKPIEAVCQMYKDGSLLGADDLAIDPIRERFSEGVVGMFPAPSYDYAVYTEQFPARCNWTVIDMPTIEEGDAPYKYIFFTQGAISIDKVAYEAANDVKKKAIEEAWLFLNSDDLHKVIYAMGGIIPAKSSITDGVQVSEKLGPQWEAFSDLTNYAPMPEFPDSVLPVEGDKFPTVFSAVMHGDVDLDAAFEDLNTRYNAAYKELKEDGDYDVSIYEHAVDISK